MANSFHDRIEGMVNNNLTSLKMVTSRTQLRLSLRSYIDNRQEVEQQKMNNIVDDICSAMMGCEEILVLTVDGDVAAATNRLQIGTDHAREDFFVRGQQDNAVDIFFVDQLKNPMLYLAGPLYLDDHLLGVVAIKKRADNIVKAMADHLPLDVGGIIYLAEKDISGQVHLILPSAGEADGRWRGEEGPDQWRILLGKAIDGVEQPVPVVVDMDSRATLTVTRSISNSGWAMMVQVDRAVVDAPFRQVHILFMVVFLLLAGLIFSIAYYLARSIARPIYKLSEAAQKISAGDMSTKVEVAADSEIGFLAQTFNIMVESIRKKTAEVKRSEETFRAVFDNAMDGILLAELQSKHFFIGNKKICQMLGYSPQEITQLAVSDIHPVEALAHVTQQFDRQVRGEITVAEDLPVRRKDGTVFFADISSAPVTIGDKKYLVGIFRDISDRKVAESALRQSQSFLAEAQRIAQLGNWEWDIIKGTFRLSEESYQIFAVSEDKFGNSYEAFMGFVHPDDREFVTKSVNKALYEKKTYFIDHRIVLADGSIRMVHEQAEVAWDSQGKPVKMVGTVQDVTSQWQAQKDLRESEETLRSITMAAHDAIIVMDDGGRVSFWNPAAEKIFGYPAREALGEDLHALIVPSKEQQGFKKGLTAFKESGSGPVIGQQLELSAVKKDGQEITIELFVSAVKLKERWNAIGIGRDISADKQAEAEKVKLEQQLRQSQKMEAIGQLAGGISHDFNNILTVIIGACGFLKEKMAEGDPQINDVEQILASAERAANLTRSLLAFSRKQVVTLVPLKINSVIRDTGKLLLKLIGEDVEMKMDLADEDITILADHGQIDQILINLAANGRDAMPGGGCLTITTSVVRLGEEFARVHGYGKPGRYMLMAVQDTGVGMDSKTQKKIFEPFFTTKEVGRGTGMGLATVYGIVKQNEGFIDVQSRPGEGTTFRIYWPTVNPGEEALREEEPVLQKGSETLLVAEDDSSILSLLDRLLTKAGYTVIPAHDGAEALEKFRQHKEQIDILLLDVIMPGKSGKEVYDEIKQQYPDIKVLFMSGYPFDLLQEKAGMSLSYNYISKPVSAKKILVKLRNILDSEGNYGSLSD